MASMEGYPKVSGEHGDRCFVNTLPDGPARPGEGGESKGDGEGRRSVDGLAKDLLVQGLDLKKLIADDPRASEGSDVGMYTGRAGTAYLLWRSYRKSKDKSDLERAAKILTDCIKEKHRGGKLRVSFCEGLPGLFALMAAVESLLGNKRGVEENVRNLRDFYTKHVADNDDHPFEWLYGYAGFLYSLLFVRKELGIEVLKSEELAPFLKFIIERGRERGGPSLPLMYKWHSKRYMGAVHGVVGIMYILLHFELSERDRTYVVNTVNGIFSTRFPSGNVPTVQLDKKDVRVHFCHGAPGAAFLACKMYALTKDKKYLDIADEMGELVWKRGLLRSVGLCHGIAGNSYVFHALSRAHGSSDKAAASKWSFRALQFAAFVSNWRNLSRAKLIHTGDSHLSLFEGLAGTALALQDAGDPEARFPCFEI